MPLVLWNPTLKAFSQTEIERHVRKFIAGGEKILAIAVPPGAPEYSKSIDGIPVIRQTGIIKSEVYIYIKGEEAYSVPRVIEAKKQIVRQDDFGVEIPATLPKKRGRPPLRPVIEAMKLEIEKANNDRGAKKRGRRKENKDSSSTQTTDKDPTANPEPKRRRRGKHPADAVGG